MYCRQRQGEPSQPGSETFKKSHDRSAWCMYEGHVIAVQFSMRGLHGRCQEQLRTRTRLYHKVLMYMRDESLTIKLKTKRPATINDTSMIDRYLQSRAIAALVRWFGQAPDGERYIAPWNEALGSVRADVVLVVCWYRVLRCYDTPKRTPNVARWHMPANGDMALYMGMN